MKILPPHSYLLSRNKCSALDGLFNVINLPSGEYFYFSKDLESHISVVAGVEAFVVVLGLMIDVEHPLCHTSCPLV